MIDAEFASDQELESRLRVALDEMIPKMVAMAAPAVESQITPALESGPLVTLHPRSRTVGTSSAQLRRARRLATVGVSVAAAFVGLIAITMRDAQTPAQHADPSLPVSTQPDWYETIRPLIPPRFVSIAETLVADQQRWFVAIDPNDGKALEVHLSTGGYATGTPSTIDSTGTWTQIPQGWAVQTPDGMFVTVGCDIGARGREFAGPPNYCEMASTGPFTSAELRATAAALADSLSTLPGSDTAAAIDPSTTIPQSRIEGAIADAVSGQSLLGGIGYGSDNDRIYDFVADADRSALPTTSVRILTGLFPPPPVSSAAAGSALYDDAAAFWWFGHDGVAVRISTTSQLPGSLTSLESAAKAIVAGAGGTEDHGPAPLDQTTTALPTTTAPPLFPRGVAWNAAITSAVETNGYSLAGTEFAAENVHPFSGSATINLSVGRIEIAVRELTADERSRVGDPQWRQQAAGARDLGVPVAEGTLFTTDDPASGAHRAVIVSATSITTVATSEVDEAHLPPIGVLVDLARALYAETPTVFS